MWRVNASVRLAARPLVGVIWFLESLTSAVERSEAELDRIFAKARFWQQNGAQALGERQVKAISRLLDAGPGGFEGGLTTKKYAHLTKTSQATAKREIRDLVDKGLLVQHPGTRARSTSYDLAWPLAGTSAERS